MAQNQGIAAVLLDTEGVIYHRPRQDHHLSAFLDTHGITMRDQVVVERALRAARLDVHSGRISREVFYDALLRVHGVFEEDLLAEGREALLADAADIELYPGVLETLGDLQAADYRLGTVSYTPHPAGSKIAWLAANGLSPGLWNVFVGSPDVGMLTAPHALFERALKQLDLAPAQVAFVGHDTEELLNAADLGLMTIAFMPDDPSVETHYTIATFYGLGDLLLNES